MTEKVLSKKQNGMGMLFLLIGGLLLCVAGFIGGIFIAEAGLPGLGIPLVILCALAFFFVCVCFGGLKVLKPQEALVLTLFGKYLGTLKGEGFYFVNPLSTAVNPAAHTKLNQSGDRQCDGAG